MGLKWVSILWLLAGVTAQALAYSGEQSEGLAPSSVDRMDRDDEYSFNWLDPDKKIYVLQNRKYRKARHPILSVMGGLGLSNPYRNSYNVDPRFAYYLNETWGLEVFYTVSFNSNNTTYDALLQRSDTTLPSVREIRGQMGAMIHYVPWYAKINVFNTILYFDWYFGLGLASLKTEIDIRAKKTDPQNFQPLDTLGFMISTGHEYYFSQNFLARLDFTGAFYQSPLIGLTGESTWFTHFNFGLGIGLKL